MRRVLARVAPIFGVSEPVERFLVDLYLGGAVFYVLAALPIGAFSAPVLALVLALGVFGGALRIVRHGVPRPFLDGLRRLPRRHAAALVAVAASVAVFAVELSAVGGVGTGNTYDSSLLATYTGLLLNHHTLPLTLAPVSPAWVAYPQGTTAWLGVAQTTLALPPARSSLLVTPLFLGVFPMAGFVFGRRLIGSAAAGATIAVFLALLAPWTRELVFGSNDFAIAAPLVLLLAAWTPRWTMETPIGRGDAVAFGALAGYAAALNPIGPEWLLLTLPLLVVLDRRARSFRLGRRFAAYALGLVAALPWVLPSLYALGPGRSPGAGGSAPGGITLSGWVGSVDPFLFSAHDRFLSPFPLLRAELALLLVLGAALIVLGIGSTVLGPAYARFLLVGGAVLAAMLGASVLVQAGLPGFGALAVLLSATEEAILLFILYAMLAAVPVVLLVEEALGHRPSPVPPERRRALAGRDRRPAAAALLAIALLLPGAVLTTSALPGQLHATYESYGNTTSADLDLLSWAATNLPGNASVLVAPGSAAEFLPAYAPSLRVVQPMAGGYREGPADYWLVVGELTNATLDARGVSALHGLAVGYVAVTQVNSILFPAFSPEPLLAAGWPVAFHEGDAYLFVVGP